MLAAMSKRRCGGVWKKGEGRARRHIACTRERGKGKGKGGWMGEIKKWMRW